MSLPTDFVVNSTEHSVRNVYLDVELAERELGAMLVVDSCELKVIEENPFVTATVYCSKPIVAISVFCTTWLAKTFGYYEKSQNRVELLREVVTAVLDSEETDKNLLDYVETYTDITIKTIHHEGDATVVEQKRRSRSRICKGQRSHFAASLANMARVKFGTMTYNDANMIMIRRWMSKVLEEAQYKDLRNVDKALALDRAMFMAFVVSEDYKRFQVMFDTTKMKDRLLMRFGASA
jgi:hypothetical protein